MPSSWKRTFYTLWIAELLVIAGMQCGNPFLPYFIQELGVGDLSEALIWSGKIGTISGLAMALSAPIWGYLADRLGRKPMVVRSMMGGAATMLLAAYVQSPEQLFWVRCLHGALSGTVTACVALVSTTAPRRELGFALGTMQGIFMLGGTVGPFLGGELIEQVGFRATYQIAGVMALIGGVLVQLLVREDFQRQRGEPSTPNAGGGRAWPGAEIWKDSWRLLQDRPYRVLAVGSFLIQFAFAIGMPVFPLFLQRLSGDLEVVSTAGLIFALAGLLGALTSMLLGKRAEALGFRRVLISSLIVSALLAVGQGVATSAFQLGMLMVASGAAAGAVRPIINVMMTTLVPRADHGKAFGIMASASALGWAPGPILGGYIGAELGFRAVFWLMAGIFCVLGFVFWSVMGRLQKENSGTTEPLPVA